MEGWIKLHRKFLEWEWFDIPEMVKLFLYLLLSANHSDNKWRGIPVKRGQLITGLSSLNKNTGLSNQVLRTCLSRLEKTGEINRQSNNQYSIITICKYEEYQVNDEDTNKQTNKPITSDQQATNKQLTANKNEKNDNNEKNISFIEKNSIFEIFYFKNFAYPEKELERFINHYSATGWKTANGIDIVDKLALAKTWKPESKDKLAPEGLLIKWHECYLSLKYKLNGESIDFLKIIPKHLNNNTLVFKINTGKETIEKLEDKFRSQFKESILSTFGPGTRIEYSPT